LLCYSAATGELLWEHLLLQGGWMPLHEKNTHASSTPACDGESVFVAGIAHGGLWATAVGLDGKRRWQQRVGPFVSQHGYGSSVALYRGLVLVAGENRGSQVSNLAGVTSYLAALERDTGSVVWRVRRPALPSYGTPTVATVAGTAQLLLSGARGVAAYDPLTGTLRWQCSWPEGRTAASVAFGDGRVFASRLHPASQTIAIRADEAGPSEREAAWSQSSGAADVPSPLWRAGKLYLLGDAGFLTCLDDQTGDVRWKLRLSGAFTASPLLAADHLYCTNEQGMTFVVVLGEPARIVARNPLNQPIFATPAPAENRLYFRTETSLICVEEPTALTRSPSR
jgi:outer membrane protein assembly factor BamB